MATKRGADSTVCAHAKQSVPVTRHKYRLRWSESSRAWRGHDRQSSFRAWWIITAGMALPSVCLAHGEEVFLSVISVILVHIVTGAVLARRCLRGRNATGVSIAFAAYTATYWMLFWVGADRYLPLASQMARFSVVTWLGILPPLAALVFPFVFRRD